MTVAAGDDGSPPPAAPRFVGRPVRRLEDPPLLRGEGRYVDDLTVPGVVHGFVVRSPHAHALITCLDPEPARAQPGVLAVFTAHDLKGHVKAKPLVLAPAAAVNPPRLALAAERVRFAGDPVAFVVAVDAATAADAADRVSVDYEPLAAVSDPEAAAAPGAPQLYAEAPGNLCYEHAWGEGDVDGAFAAAHRVVRLRLVNQRLAAAPMEPRGCLASWQGGALTLWTSTQGAHKAKALLAETLGVPEHLVRVIAPDVGGGFGAKFGLFDEEVLTAFAARRLGRPVKWIERRAESMAATPHGRAMVHVGELAVAADGAITGLRVTGTADMGAHLESFTCVPAILCGRLVPGAYRVPAAAYSLRAVFTTAAPTGPYRGAGRPEAAYIVERLIDLAARELALDPVELRRRNFVRDAEFPFRSVSGLTYDSGRYGATLDRALELLGYEAVRAEQARLRREGRYLGVGFAAFLETASTGPSRIGVMAGHEYGAVRVEPSGRAVVLTGTSPHGQGTATTLAQIVADELGLTPGDITVIHGDTAVVPMGFGTAASRGATVGGTAARLAAEAVRDKARAIAAHLLEAAPADVEFERGRFQVRGVPGRAVGLAQIARVAHRGQQLPAGMDPGLEAARVFDPAGLTVPFGVYAAVVEVLRETGEVRLHRFAGVDDVGTVLNPMLLEGQLHGGIAQGIAQALWEDVVYDARGQLLTATLMDYAVPRADRLPVFELAHTVTPTPLNPLGAKGAGEAGCVGAPPAVVNAVVDALAPFGVRHVDMPLRPERLWRLMQRGPDPSSSP